MDDDYQSKIVDGHGLADAVAQVRADGRSIVLCHGCFDIVHPGHIRYLEFARKHGDLLIVSITSDAAIDKESDRPYIPEELRAENLAALSFVDLVYVDPNHTAEQVLQLVKPDVYVKGHEYQLSKDPRFLAEQTAVEQYGGKVIFSSGDLVFSSTELIRRIGRDVDLEAQRLQYVTRRHNISLDTLESIIARFQQRRVVVVGDLVVDRYVFCDTIDIARESPMMSLKQLEEHTYLGGAGIVARHLARLGATVQLVTSLGKDSLSRDADAQLKADNIEIHSLLNRGALPIKRRYLVEDTKLFKIEQAERRPLDTRAAKRSRKILLELAEQADALVFCDFGYGVITEALLSMVLPELRQEVKIITADVSGTHGDLLRFEDVDLICPTEREIRSTLHNFEEGLSAVAWQLMDATRAKHLIATLGRRGLVAFDRQSQDPASPDWAGRLRSEYFQALNGRAIDVLGCGDALLAGCTLALTCGASFIQAAYLGNVMAAIEASDLGNIPIDLERLRRWLTAQPELIHLPERQPIC